MIEIIKIKNANFSYNDKTIFKNLNLIINKNDCIGIFGESGSGKTTLIDIIMTLNKLDNVKSSTDINVLVPGIEDAVDDLRTFRDDKQKELDEFESYYSPNSKSMPSENIVMPVADPVNN